MSHQTRYNVQLSKKCDTTGWPIDIKLKDGLNQYQQQPFPFDVSSPSLMSQPPSEYSGVSRPKEMALYFLLQEEMCYNVESR